MNHYMRLESLYLSHGLSAGTEVALNDWWGSPCQAKRSYLPLFIKHLQHLAPEEACGTSDENARPTLRGT
jgi:hypothetical protein